MNKSNIKNNYAAPDSSVLRLKPEMILCQSGIKSLQDMGEESLFDEDFN